MTFVSKQRHHKANRFNNMSRIVWQLVYLADSADDELAAAQLPAVSATINIILAPCCLELYRSFQKIRGLNIGVMLDIPQIVGLRLQAHPQEGPPNFEKRPCRWLFTES